jgi:hypothetical protein
MDDLRVTFSAEIRLVKEGGKIDRNLIERRLDVLSQYEEGTNVILLDDPERAVVEGSRILGRSTLSGAVADIVSQIDLSAPEQEYRVFKIEAEIISPTN